ncbi:T9SS type A sorting domain-containing protein [Chryseolinea sp. T2]|uniref:T9SS type A sorting domain-containing protein n=1 Tax=Chryseolinea sp. T2 TaxID=3129255 RepID=UPI003076AD7D
MMRLVGSFLFLQLLSLFAAAQGSLVMVGGGSEAEGGWSDEPYRWIVDHAPNKRIAVISYSDEDNWIPDYFLSLGAAAATNIKIASRTVADHQSTYDNLMTYDAFFFKGGDQSIYYTQYKGTRTLQAAIDKFQAGGVMSGTSAGMAILSGVVYTAKNDSAYPDETLANIYDKRITLANDFLTFLPGYLADSHFTERGRVGRLLPFLSRWYYDHGEQLTGIGIDDRTALCIDTNKMAKVLGTGTVSFYRASSWSLVRDEIPVSSSIGVVQLLHGQGIDLATNQVLDGPAGQVRPTPAEENGNYKLALSGSNDIAQNSALLNFIVRENGALNDSVVLVTAPGMGKAFSQKLVELGARVLVVETSTAVNDAGKIDLRNAIRRSTKVLFAENADEALFDFLNGGRTGQLLYRHIRRNGMVVAFAGEDSRYAGRSFPTNYRTDKYAAYYGRLSYRKGLRLLSTSVIMPNTFDPATSDFIENATAAISYAMVADSARFGIYLNAKNMIRFYQQEGTSYLKGSGNQSVLMLMNEGTNANVAFQPVGNGEAARNYAGFASMRYALLNGEMTVGAGAPSVSPDEPEEFEYPILAVEHEFNQSSLQIFPNPSADGRFHIFRDPQFSEGSKLTVSDFMGRTLHVQRVKSPDEILDLSSSPDGIYLLRIESGLEISTIKVIKRSN